MSDQSANPGIAALQRLGDVLASNPWYWLFFLGGLGLLTICSLECFRKRWLRAFVAGALSFECAWFLCAGYLA
jgi:hypothetical protein